jgi:hypothetical protein
MPYLSSIIKCAKKYSRTTRALALFPPTPTSSDTTSALTTLHLESDGYFLFFLEDYEPNQNFELFFDSFKEAFQHMPHLSASGL